MMLFIYSSVPDNTKRGQFEIVCAYAVPRCALLLALGLCAHCGFACAFVRLAVLVLAPLLRGVLHHAHSARYVVRQLCSRLWIFADCDARFVDVQERAVSAPTSGSGSLVPALCT
jgi:hypothetical protein